MLACRVSTFELHKLSASMTSNVDQSDRLYNLKSFCEENYHRVQRSGQPW